MLLNVFKKVLLMKFRLFFYYWLPVIIWMGLIFYFSSQPIIYLEFILEEEIGLPIERWVMHIIEYAILSGLLYRALMKSRLRKYSFVLAILMSIFYGLSDEVHQIFVIGRSFDFLDLLMDSIGAILMQIIIKTLRYFELLVSHADR